MKTILQDPMFNSPAWSVLDPFTLQEPTGSGAFVPNPLSAYQPAPPPFTANDPQSQQPGPGPDPGNIGGYSGIDPGGLGGYPGGPGGGLGGFFSGIGPAIASGAGSIAGGLLGGPVGSLAGGILGRGAAGLFGPNNQQGYAWAPAQYTDTSGGDIGAGGTVNTGAGGTGVGMYGGDGSLVGIQGWSPEAFSYFTDPNGPHADPLGYGNASNPFGFGQAAPSDPSISAPSISAPGAPGTIGSVDASGGWGWGV